MKNYVRIQWKKFQFLKDRAERKFIFPEKNKIMPLIIVKIKKINKLKPN
jgi:hypothetical protein